MKKLLSLLLVLITMLSINTLFKTNKKLLAEPQIYYEYTKVVPNENKAIKKVYTNTQDEREKLTRLGFTHENSEDVFTKTENLTNQTDLTSNNSFYKKVEEVFELQNNMFKKMNEMFNEFFETNTLIEDAQNKQNIQENIQNNNDESNQVNPEINKEINQDINNKISLENSNDFIGEENFETTQNPTFKNETQTYNENAF